MAETARINLTRGRRAAVFAVAAALVAGLASASLAYAAVANVTRVSVVGASSQISKGSNSAPSISADGNLVVFESDASMTVLAMSGGYPNGTNIYLRNVSAGTLTLISKGVSGHAADGPSHAPVISADGKYVVFSSLASNLIAMGTGTNAGIYRYSVADPNHTLQRVDSTADYPPQWNPNLARSQDWWRSAVSRDGRYVAYAAPTTPGASLLQVYRRDMLTGEILLVSFGTNGAGVWPSMHPAISADGSRIAFTCNDNLTGTVRDSGSHVFMRDVAANTLALVSAPDPGMPAVAGNSDWPAMDAAGIVVAFTSTASNLVTPTVSTAASNVYVRDFATGTTRLASSGTLGAATQDCCNPSVSDNGRYVAFQSSADNLKVTGTFYPYFALYVLDRTKSAPSCIAPISVPQPIDDGSATGFSAGGRFVVFSSECAALVSGDTNGMRDVFRYEYLFKPVPTMGTPRTSTSYIRRYRTFTLSGTVTAHPGARAVVQLKLYRYYSNGTRSLYKTYSVSTGVGMSLYKKSIALPYTGTWRVIAVHPECDQFKTNASAYRKFTVYR